MWEKFSQTPSYTSWSGFAFENICLKHIAPIKKALGISGIYSETSVFKNLNPDFSSIQIDMVADRNDHVIDLFEFKFYNTEYTISKEYGEKLRQKMAVFKEATKTKKQIFINMLTTFGCFKNTHHQSIISKSLTMDALFLEDEYEMG